MSNEVQFDFDTESRPQYGTKIPKLIQLVTRYSGGYIKDEKQANYILVGFALVAITVSLFLFIGGNKPQVPNPLNDYKYHPSRP